jgi:hypothetical protein
MYSVGQDDNRLLHIRKSCLAGLNMLSLIFVFCRALLCMILAHALSVAVCNENAIMFEEIVLLLFERLSSRNCIVLLKLHGTSVG